MQTDLLLCREYLKEVEAKLKQLERAASNELESYSKVSEALFFIRQAIIALSQIREQKAERGVARALNPRGRGRPKKLKVRKSRRHSAVRRSGVCKGFRPAMQAFDAVQ